MNLNLLIYSTNNLPEINDGTYVLNLDEYELAGTHWIALYKNGDNIIYFDSFGVEYFPKEIKNFIDNKNIITNIDRIQAYQSIMCRYFCIGFVDFMLKGKCLLEYANLLSPKQYQKKDVILKYFQWNLSELKGRKTILLFAINIENFKRLNIYLKKISVLFLH